MKTLLVLYATREGHTERIAGRLAVAIRARGHSADAIDAANPPERFRLDLYDAALLAASVHAGHHEKEHEKEMVEFVRQHKLGLEQIPTVFLSVSLAEAGAENEKASPEMRAKAAADVEEMIHRFLEETGWHPGKIQAVAGALLYTQYNFLIRLVMKRIAAASGGSTDTTLDHTYTDWAMLDQLIDELVRNWQA